MAQGPAESSRDQRKDLRILAIRPDRVGDVILSTPVFDVLKRHYPRSKLTVMVREGVAPVIRGLPSVDEVLIYDPDGRHAGTAGFFRLIAEIRERGFRIAVVLHSHWRIAAALFAAGIRYRVGPLSKLHSFLFYNRGIRQRRSHVEMHESDYNLQLLRKLGIRVGTRNIPTRVNVSPDARARAREWLLSQGWDGSARVVAVHPGMGGSALNWPEAHYVEFIRVLAREGFQIVITGGPSEGPLLGRVKEALGELQSARFKPIYYGGPGTGPLDQLGGVLSHASLVVAPSTGPLHLAVALGRPVVTFYPPIRVQSAIRWGPYIGDETRASVLVPEVYCGEDFECRGSLCNYYPCMKSLTVAQALEQAHFQLARAEHTNG